MSKRFHYDWKTGRMKDTQSNSQATKDMRVLETIINDACYSYEKRIKELEKENEELKQRIKEETDRVIKLEQYVYTKLCPKSENYNEKVVSAIINTILGDVE